jgi:hypothetical protein
MEELIELWKNYNLSANQLKEKLNRTFNLVGEYAEYLINEFVQGKLLTASNASADICCEKGKFYQVKARKIQNLSTSTQLSVIRSWDFDFLAVILFNENGNVIKALLCPKFVSKKYAVQNIHQNGWVITTTNKFLIDVDNIDITFEIQKLNNDHNADFSKIKEPRAREINVTNQLKENSKDIISNEIRKIEKRIPKWFNNPNQINSQILIAFMQLYELNRLVTYDELEQKCASIKSFKPNFNEMIILAEKNHSKVFEKADSLITLWEPVKQFIYLEYQRFKRQNHI